MKKIINKILSNFNLELHGKNYITKLKAESNSKNAFQFQKEFFENKKLIPQIIFDLGANTGSITEKYLQIFPQATIHAFEPTIELKDSLINKFHNIKNVIINDKAVSDKNEVTKFYKNKVNDTNSLLASSKIGASSDNACINVDTYNVQTLTLDKYCFDNNIEQIDILKMDIQGAELLALKGAIHLLKNKKIKLIYTEAYFLEQYKGQALFNEIYSFLKTYNYQLQDFYNPYFVDNHLAWNDVIFTIND